jgi:hypothetical protein
MHAQGLQAVPGGSVVELPGGPARARHGPSAAHGEASKQEDPAQDRARVGLMGVRRQGLEPRTVALRGHCSAN